MSIALPATATTAPTRFSTAQIIRRFRALKMPLDDIRTVISTTDIRQRNELMNTKLVRLESQLAHTKHAVEPAAGTA